MWFKLFIALLSVGFCVFVFVALTKQEKDQKPQEENGTPGGGGTPIETPVDDPEKPDLGNIEETDQKVE